MFLVLCRRDDEVLLVLDREDVVLLVLKVERIFTFKKSLGLVPYLFFTLLKSLETSH